MEKPNHNEVCRIVKRLYHDPECVYLTLRLVGGKPLNKIVIRPTDNSIDTNSTFAERGERVVIGFYEYGIIAVYNKNANAHSAQDKQTHLFTFLSSQSI